MSQAPVERLCLGFFQDHAQVFFGSLVHLGSRRCHAETPLVRVRSSATRDSMKDEAIHHFQVGLVCTMRDNIR